MKHREVKTAPDDQKKNWSWRSNYQQLSHGKVCQINRRKRWIIAKFMTSSLNGRENRFLHLLIDTQKRNEWNSRDVGEKLRLNTVSRKNFIFGEDRSAGFLLSTVNILLNIVSLKLKTYQVFSLSLSISIPPFKVWILCWLLKDTIMIKVQIGVLLNIHNH